MFSCQLVNLKKNCFLLIEISRHKSFSRTKMTLRLKMSIDLSGPTKSNIALIFGAILGIVSSIICFGFIFKKLKINHVIKKLLLFATVQQSLGYGIFFGSILAIGFGIQNKVTCFFAFTSIIGSTIGTQASISMLSVIRWFFNVFFGNWNCPEKSYKL